MSSAHETALTPGPSPATAADQRSPSQALARLRQLSDLIDETLRKLSASTDWGNNTRWSRELIDYREERKALLAHIKPRLVCE